MHENDHVAGVERPQTLTRRISRPWTLAAAAAAALAVGATGFAASAAPPNQARALGELFFNRNMARAEVVMVTRGVVHDFRLDQGKIVSVRPGAIELLERDGAREVIPVSPTAQILLNGRFVPLAALPLRVNAITVRDGDQPATSVRATGSQRK